MPSDLKTAKNFNAFAHPRRIRIFRLLSSQKHKKATFGQICRAAKLNRAAAAHHLRVMEEGGLIRRVFNGPYTEVRLTEAWATKAIADLISNPTGLRLAS